MTTPVFVLDRDRLLGSERVVLDGPEGRHAARVRRIGVGEQVVVTDGAGMRAACRVEAVGPDHLELVVEGRAELPVPEPRLVVVQALPKGDRGELAAATLTEVGADVIVPWAAARCVTRWSGDRGAKALQRWRTTVREAAKQSRRVHFPEVTEPVSTALVADRLRSAAAGVVLHEEACAPLAGAGPLPVSGEVVVVVGPEGGLTTDELAAFDEAGATAYRLGPTVLRTSTAGVAALAVVLSRTSRWA